MCIYVYLDVYFMCQDGVQSLKYLWVVVIEGTDENKIKYVYSRA